MTTRHEPKDNFVKKLNTTDLDVQSLGQAPQLQFALRLAGCWLLWSAWCSVAGWGLSAIQQLSGWGYLSALPLLIGAVALWWKSTATPLPCNFNLHKWGRRMTRPLPLIFCLTAGLSLVAAVVNPDPWSFDATTYRLPRVLYWLAAKHWHWIGTIDQRLDFSSLGFEWQMLPIIELTRSDRFIFLLNWVPFLLLPWLAFVAFQGLGLRKHTSRRWMWLLPSGFCIALQSGGLQNDGYSVNYLLASVSFAIIGVRRKSFGLVLMSLLAAAQLTGAKVSNLPLVLPLGVLVLWAFSKVRWMLAPTVATLLIAGITSFLPLAYQCVKHTGDWTGNPHDQWHVKTHGFIMPFVANTIILLNDCAQPPYLPQSRSVNARLEDANNSEFIARLKRAHGEFLGIGFGEMAYEGGAGMGFGIAIYLLNLAVGSLFSGRRATMPPISLPTVLKIVPWLAWLGYFVFLVKLGSNHSARIAAPFYPLLLIPILRCPRVFKLERRKAFSIAAGLAALIVIPIIILTPIRPLISLEVATTFTSSPKVQKIAEKYRFWRNLRDDLAPLREHLPAASTFGFAGGFRDTSYGLWKPFGRHKIVEVGLPLGSKTLPPPHLTYVVITDRGLTDRYGCDLATWLKQTSGTVVFEYRRNIMLDAHSAPQFESWFIVKLNPQKTN